jgi:hypothetical protein
VGRLGRLAEFARNLVGISAYEAGATSLGSVDLDSATVEQLRRMFGGQLQPLSGSQTRWYIDDVETAEHLADSGSLAQAARLWSAARRDATVSGLLATRTGGLVRLPKRFEGDPKICADLERGHYAQTGQVRSAFDEMCPPTELALLAADGLGVGVAVGELVPVEGRDYPVLVRLDPQFLTYRWAENRWYFRSLMGLVPITPGDGRWVLHVPGGRNAPWQNGLWRAIGIAFIRKTHAALYRDNWESKLANPARVAQAPNGASDEQKASWFKKVAAWGVNTVFQVAPGYEVKLIESNGRGWESFKETIAEQNTEIQISLAGQTVTTDGGTGFANADIHKSIRADLIKETADGLAFTINTQCIPAFVLFRYGEEALDRCPVMAWDVTPPKDLAQIAETFGKASQAISQLTETLAPHGLRPDVRAMCTLFAIPVLEGALELPQQEAGAGGDELDQARARMRPGLVKAKREREATKEAA